MTAELKKTFHPLLAGLYDVGVASPADPQRFASEMWNVVPMSEGGVRKRGGYRCITAHPLANSRKVAGIFAGRFATGNTEVIVTSVDSQSASSGSQTTRVYGPGIFETIQGQFGSVPDYMIIGDTLLVTSEGRGPSLYVLGYSPVTAKTIPSGRFLSYHNSRLWVGNIVDEPESIRISAPGRIGEFRVSEGGVRVGLPTGSGGPITGISKPFLGENYVFTETSISVVQVISSSDIPISRISSSIGAIAHQTIRQVGNDLFFVSPRGLHSLLATDKYGGREAAFLSAPIQRFWNRIDPDRLRQAWATYWPQRDLYILCLPLRGTPGLYNPGENYGLDHNIMLVYHVSSGRWAIWDWPGTCVTMVQSTFTPGYPVAMVGGGQLDGASLGWGWIDGEDFFDLPRPVTAGTTRVAIEGYKRPYKFRFVTHRIDCGDNAVTKRFTKITLYFYSGAWANMTVRWIVDDRTEKTSSPPERYLEEADVFLNPDKGPLIDSSNKANDNGETHRVLGTDYFPLGQNRNASYATVSIGDTGNEIRFEFETEDDHPLQLLGFELWYVPQAALASRVREIDDDTGVESVVVWVEPVSAAPVGPPGLGDDFEVG